MVSVILLVSMGLKISEVENSSKLPANLNTERANLTTITREIMVARSATSDIIIVITRSFDVTLNLNIAIN